MNDVQSDTSAALTDDGEQMLSGNTEDVEINTRYIESDDDERGSSGSSSSVTMNDGGEDEPPQNVSAFQLMHSIDLGHVLVTDNETGETLTQWKAKSGDESYVSADPFDALMGLLEKLMGDGY